MQIYIFKILSLKQQTTRNPVQSMTWTLTTNTAVYSPHQEWTLTTSWGIIHTARRKLQQTPALFLSITEVYCHPQGNCHMCTCVLLIHRRHDNNHANMAARVSNQILLFETYVVAMNLTLLNCLTLLHVHDSYWTQTIINVHKWFW